MPTPTGYLSSAPVTITNTDATNPLPLSYTAEYVAAGAALTALAASGTCKSFLTTLPDGTSVAGDAANYPEGYPADLAVFYGGSQIDCEVATYNRTNNAVIVRFKLQAAIAAAGNDAGYTLAWGKSGVTAANLTTLGGRLANIYLASDNFPGSSLSGYTKVGIFAETVSGNVYSAQGASGGGGGEFKALPGAVGGVFNAFDISVDAAYNQAPNADTLGISLSDNASQFYQLTIDNNIGGGSTGFGRIGQQGVALGGAIPPAAAPGANVYSKMRFKGTGATAPTGTTPTNLFGKVFLAGTAPVAFSTIGTGSGAFTAKNTAAYGLGAPQGASSEIASYRYLRVRTPFALEPTVAGGSVTTAPAGTTYLASNSLIRLKPGQWDTLSSTVVGFGAGSARTSYSGAQAKIAVQGLANGQNIALNFDSINGATAGVPLVYWWDNGGRVNAPGGGAVASTVTLADCPDTGLHVLNLQLGFMPGGPNRWAGGAANQVVFTSVTPSAGTLVAVPASSYPPKKMLVLGDSRAGDLNANSYDVPTSAPSSFATALGYEHCTRGVASSGWAIMNAAAGGYPNDLTTRFQNLYAGVPDPFTYDAITAFFGLNDFVGSGASAVASSAPAGSQSLANDAGVTASVLTFMTAARAKNPAAVIYIALDHALTLTQKNAAIKAGFAAYQAANPSDANVILVDPNKGGTGPAFIGLDGSIIPSVYSSDGFHQGVLLNAQITGKYVASVIGTAATTAAAPPLTRAQAAAVIARGMDIIWKGLIYGDATALPPEFV